MPGRSTAAGVSHARLLFAASFALLAAPACRRRRPRHPVGYAYAAASGPPARAFRAVRPEDLLAGPEAVGKPGDAVLDNGRVRAVIDDVTHGGGGFSLSGGQLVDLAPAPDGRDELGQMFSFLGTFPRQLRYTTMRLENRADGSAAVVVSGDDPRTPGLRGETVYSLARGDGALTITTTLINSGTLPTEVGAGDAIQWSGAEHWAPGRGFALKGDNTERYLAGVGVFTAYAYAARADLSGANGTHWSNPVVLHTTIAPGHRVAYTRRVGVSRAGDVAGAVAATRMLPAMPSLTVRVRDASGAPVPGARVWLAGASEAAGPAALSATDNAGVATVLAPAGSYALRVDAPGRAVAESSRGALREPVVLDKNSGPAAERAVTMTDPSSLAVDAVETAWDDAPGALPRGVPARVLLYGEDGTADPMLGAIGRADGARNSFVVSPAHPVRVPLAPGRYRVVVTHGPERTLGEAHVEVGAGQAQSVTVALRRVLDTRGYVCGDFHTHQAPSLDSPVSLRDRARAAAAEGLEVLASTDHNVATQLGPAVRDEGLAGQLLALGGVEVSTDPALRPTGHWNIYPFDVRPEQPLGGVPALFDLDAPTVVRRVREAAPGAVLQVNHPRSGAPTGLFDVVGFRRETGRGTTGAFEPTFDALEVWNGRFQPQAETVLLDWLSLLRQGARITAMANSDSHAIVVQEVGYPRTCLAAPTDDPAALTPTDVARAVRETRDTLLTDGPFVRVLGTDGASAVGRTLAAGPDGAVLLRVRVESVSWDAADALELVHADGRFEPVAVSWRAEGDVVRGEVDVRVRPADDAFVLFRARGTRPIPVLLGEPTLYPMALTNPVYLR